MFLVKNGSGWQQISNEFSMKKILPDSPEYRTFQDMDTLLGGGELIYSNIFAVHNERLVNSFTNYRSILSSRHQDDPNIFAKTDWKIAPEPERRQWTIDMYSKYVQRFSWNLSLDTVDLTLLPVIAAVHGTSNTVAQKICRNGFAALSTLDKGYYGQGIYFTCHVPYIFPYVISAKNPTMLVVLIFPGNVYPIIESPTSPDSFLGKPMKSGYQSHFIVTGKNGLPIEDYSRTSVYDELVITQESQILPIYLVELKNSNFSEMAKNWQREVPKPCEE